MAAAEALTPRLDQLIALFNGRKIDLPDGLFHRQTQFCLNGEPFETLLGRPPDDPLVLMLARGPAGYRFALKALQHAMPDAAVERGEVLTTGDPYRASAKVWLSGHLRDTRAAIETIVDVSLQFAEAGWVAVADARVDAVALARLKAARLSD